MFFLYGDVMRNNLILIILLLSVFFLAGNLYAQTDEECMGCHIDPSLTMTKNGRTISLEVKPFHIPRSVHKAFKCIDCHQDYEPYNIPHKENIEPVNCTRCHTKTTEDHKFHPQMKMASGTGGSANVDCKGCHGTHQIQSPNNPESELHFTNSTEFCGKCHADVKADHLASVHMIELEHNNPDAPTCIYCHQNDITKGSLLSESDLKVNQERMCLECHLSAINVNNEYTKSLIKYESSVHGKAILEGNADAAVCVDCHGAHRLQKASNPESDIHHKNLHNVCGQCHTDITHEYLESVHGTALTRGIEDVPNCTYCHGEHNIHAVPEVPHDVFTENGMQFEKLEGTQMIWCVDCHSDKELMEKYDLATIKDGHEWLPSAPAHWETVRCIDCHSSYDPPNLSHHILTREKTVKKCEECHSQNSVLMSKLYTHEKEQSRDKYGFVNGTLLSDAYVVGTTRNIYLDTLSFIIFAGTVLGIFTHGFLRWKTRKNKKDKK